ncbi:MAG: type II secretion system protein GspN [Pseudobdellovibrio sp.]
MNGIIFAFRFIFANKWKIVLTAWFTLIFIFILFPFNDLNDLISAQISKLTQNKIFVQFDRMNLSPIGPKISLEKIFVESGSTPTITADDVSVSPSLSSLISKQPEGTITASGILKGDVEIRLKSAAKSESGLARSKLDIQAKNLSLKEIRDLAQLPMPLRGTLSITSTALADLTFTEQPEAEMAIAILKFEMPSSSVALADMGRVNLPELKFATVELKGKLANGKFIIENGKLGNNKDELYGDIKGDLSVTFQNRDGQITPILGGYNIDLNLKATTAFKERAKFFLTFLDGYKSEVADGTQYKFKIQALAGMPPQFTQLH